MNLLYYVETFPKLSESFVLNEIYELERRGHNVTVFAHNEPDKDITHTEYTDLDVDVAYAETPSVTDLPDLISPTVLAPQVLRHAYLWINPLRLAAGLHRAHQYIRFVDDLDVDPDLVHSHFATVPTYAARYVAGHYRIPHTVTTHAFDLYDDVDQRFLQTYLGGADHVITISEYNRNYIEEHVDGTSVSVVHAGIRPEKFAPTGPETTVDSRILTVARFVEKKGLEYALKGVATLVHRGFDIEYHIIGDGKRRKRLESMVANLGLEETVEFLGSVDEDRLAREYDEAACFLLPCVIAESGDRDGIPVVLMEAMAMETPPVSTTVSGIPELVKDGETGLLAAPTDIGELSIAIERLLTNPDLRTAYGTSGRETVAAEFNITAEAAKTESIFDTVTSSRRSQSRIRLRNVAEILQ